MVPDRAAAQGDARRAGARRGRCAARGLEDVFVGDVAQDVRARLAVNPKALERELAG